MMKKIKKSLALILSMLMLISVFQVGASAYFPYINEGGAGDAISKDFQITSVNVTDLYGNEVTSLAEGGDALVSCKIKALGEKKDVQLIAAAYSGSEMVAVKRSDVVTLGKNAEDVGVYLTATEAADSFKAFLWDGSTKLIPLTKSADTASKNVNVLSVYFNGEQKKEDTYEYDVTIPAHQLDMPSVQILTDNPAARVEVTSSKPFPISKQWDSIDGEAVITAKVTLNGEAKAEYTFNVTQAVPEITNAKMYEWNNGSGTTLVYYKNGDKTQYKAEDDSVNAGNSGPFFSVNKLAEADYTGSTTKRSEIEDSTLVESGISNPVYLQYSTGSANEFLIYNIPNEFINGAVFQRVNRGSTSNRPLSMASLVNKSSTTGINKNDAVPSSQYASYTFDLNRSATVYVYNNENTTQFETEGFINDENLTLYYYNFKSSVVVPLSGSWYKKHIDVTGNTAVSVAIPVGAHPITVIVKFDEAENKSVVTNATCTTTDGTTDTSVALAPTKLFKPLLIDDNDSTVTGKLSKHFFNAVTGWPDTTYKISGLNDYAVGAELLYGIPSDTTTVKDITFTLTDSADVYFEINCKDSVRVAHWLEVFPDWIKDGWRLVNRDEMPVKNYTSNSAFIELTKTTAGNTKAIMKHFDVADGETVTVSLNDLQRLQRDHTNSTFMGNTRPVMVIVKKTDR